MARDTDYITLCDDPLRVAVGLPFGPEGGYYVHGGGFRGQASDPSILDGNLNQPPAGQPSLWRHWEPNADGTSIIYLNECSFYDYIPWLFYLIEHFLNGSVEWQGEDPEDAGILAVENNLITVQEYVRDLGPKQAYSGESQP
jgi:hypothetical protein